MNTCKSLLFCLFFSCCFFVSKSQTIVPNVVNSAGGQFSNNDFSLEWSLGEVVISTIQNNSNILTNGFLQPNLNTVSFLEFDNPNLIVYPNPFENIIFINDQTNNNQFWNLKLYNSEGKILLEEKKVNQLDLEFLANGMYIIHISDVNNNFKESFKISKFN